MMGRVVLGRELMAYVLMSLKKKWRQCINDKFEYDREGLMNIYGFSWLLVFYSDIILVGNCLKRG